MNNLGKLNNPATTSNPIILGLKKLMEEEQQDYDYIMNRVKMYREVPEDHMLADANRILARADLHGIECYQKAIDLVSRYFDQNYVSHSYEPNTRQRTSSDESFFEGVDTK